MTLRAQRVAPVIDSGAVDKAICRTGFDNVPAYATVRVSIEQVNLPCPWVS